MIHPLPELHWRCFHCGEVFSTADEARVHFGANETEEPGCIMHLGADERSMLRRLRACKDELEMYRLEDGPMQREMMAMKSKHATELIRMEEHGYNKGVADCHKLVKAARDALTAARQELWVDYCLGRGRTDCDPAPFNSRPVIRVIDDGLKESQ